jgi:pyruvate formate lyase activating enzyme
VVVIAGLQKNSLIDYPGKISAVVFISGCNFACPFCHNPELARGAYPQRIALDELLVFLDRRKNLLDGVVITGGEPTIWPHLASLCRAIKGLNLEIKLDTNGSLPEILSQVMTEELVDYVAMDIKTNLENYGPPLCRRSIGSKIRQSIGILMDGAVDYEFRTTCVPPFVDETKLKRIALEIANARRYVLQPFRPLTVLDRNFFAHHPTAVSAGQMERFKAAVSDLVPSCRIR